jgi:hypothetical protein
LANFLTFEDSKKPIRHEIYYYSKMVEDLIKKKADIINQHMERIIDANQKILETIGNILKDKKVNAGFKLKVQEIVNLSASGGGGSTTGMESSDKLELARGFFNNANSILETLRNRPEYDSLIKNIDDQLQIYRGEIEAIDEKLKVVEDKETRKDLWRQRERAGQKSV